MPPVPPTPFLPTRSGGIDESLLLATEPIFDTSLDESVWGVPAAHSPVSTSRPFEASQPVGMSTVRRPTRSATVQFNDRTPNSHSKLSQTPKPAARGDLTLNLNDYLPAEETNFDVTVLVERGEGTGVSGDARSGDRVESGMKRDGSSGLLAQELCVKKPKSRSPRRDDYFSRRLSCSLSRPSISSPHMPTPQPLSASSSSRYDLDRSSGQPSPLSSSSSSSSSSRTKAHKDAFRREREERTTQPRQTEVGLTRSQGDDTFFGNIHNDPQPIAGPSRIPRSATSAPPRQSALSRYLAKSAVLHPPPRQSVPDSATPALAPTIPRPEIKAVVEPSVMYQDDACGGGEGNELPPERDEMPPQGHRSSPRDSPLADQPPEEACGRVTQDGSTVCATTTKGSNQRERRASTSERIVDYLTNLLRPVTPTVSALKSPDVQDGQASATPTEDIVGEPRPSSNRTQDHPLDQPPTRSSSSASTSSARRPVSRNPNPPGYIPLTRPANKALATATATRALQPTRTTFTQPSKATLQSSFIKSRAPPTKSAFTSAALARLPPPGKGSTSAGTKVQVKPLERARDLNIKRAIFDHSDGKPASKSVMSRTVPISGHTPGKASRERMQRRAEFDKVVKEKLDEKERLRLEAERRRAEEEEKRYRDSRKETVVWAKPVPEIYRKNVEKGGIRAALA